MTSLFWKPESHRSQSNYFNVSPPGGDVSLTPKQAFTAGEGVEAKFYPASFPLNLQKNDSPTLWRKKANLFSEQRGQFMLETERYLCLEISPLFREHSRNFIFCGYILVQRELGEVGTGGP